MRTMTVGMMVRQNVYKNLLDEAVYRYGLIVQEIDNLPVKDGKKYYKVLWQPTDKYAVSRNRSYADVVSSDLLQLVSGVPSRSLKESDDAEG